MMLVEIGKHIVEKMGKRLWKEREGERERERERERKRGEGREAYL